MWGTAGLGKRSLIGGIRKMGLSLEFFLTKGGNKNQTSHFLGFFFKFWCGCVAAQVLSLLFSLQKPNKNRFYWSLHQGLPLIRGTNNHEQPRIWQPREILHNPELPRMMFFKQWFYSRILNQCLMTMTKACSYIFWWFLDCHRLSPYCAFCDQI